MVTSDDGRRLIETREELVLDFALDGPSGDDVGSADATGLDQWAIGDGVATAVTPMRPMGVVA